MQLSDYLQENLDDKHVDIIDDILSTFQNRENIVIGFFEYFKNNMVEKIKKECNLDDTWDVHVDTEKMQSKYWRAVTIGKKTWADQNSYVEYGWEVEKPSVGDSYYGIFFKGDISPWEVDFSIIRNKRELPTFKDDKWTPLYNDSCNTHSTSTLVQFYCAKKKMAEKIAEEMIYLIKHTMHDVEEINQRLAIEYRFK